MARSLSPIKLTRLTSLQLGATLANNGMRIGGDFAANGGVSANDTMVDWSPTDTASGMAALGNDLFSISVTYPASSIGATPVL